MHGPSHPWGVHVVELFDEHQQSALTGILPAQCSRERQGRVPCLDVKVTGGIRRITPRRCSWIRYHRLRGIDPMSDTYNYLAQIERDEDGRYVVSSPDFGWGATDGATLEEALSEARDLLRELIATTMREGNGLPEPSRAGQQRYLVVPPVPIAPARRCR